MAGASLAVHSLPGRSQAKALLGPFVCFLFGHQPAPTGVSAPLEFNWKLQTSNFKAISEARKGVFSVSDYPSF